VLADAARWLADEVSIIRKKYFCGCGENAAATVAWLGLLVAVKAGVEVAGADRRLDAIKAGLVRWPGDVAGLLLSRLF
jgi:hypothetical protein